MKQELEKMMEYINSSRKSTNAIQIPVQRKIYNQQFTKDFLTQISNLTEHVRNFNLDMYDNLKLIHANISKPVSGYGAPVYIFDQYCLGGLEAIVENMLSNLDKTIRHRKIFISHSSEDVNYVAPFTDLLINIGASKDNLFCSSIEGFGIPLGRDIIDFLRDEFINNELLVIFILSKNYYKSAFCLNEMGAAWGFKYDYQSILLPKFDLKNIKGSIYPSKLALKLDDSQNISYKLNDLKEIIIQYLSLEPIEQNNWERCRDKFILTVKKQILN